MERTVGFDVDGKHYTLKYDFNAVCDIERVMGVGITTMMSGDRVGMDTIRCVIWGGLKWKLPGFTIQASGNLIQKYMEINGDITKLANDAIKLLGESIGGKEKADEVEDVGE